MTKYFMIFLVLITFTISCNKTSENEEVVAKLKGKWTAISLKVDGEETVIPNISKFVTEFYDFNGTKGRYNLKVYALGLLAGETEGSAEVKNNGTKLILIEEGTSKTETSTIETLSDDLLRINGVNDNGDLISFVGEKN